MTDAAKEWTFPPADDPLTIQLSANSNGSTGNENRTFYNLHIINSRHPQTSIAEAKYLAIVIEDMRSSGIPIEKNLSIMLTIVEPDVSRQLSFAAFNSDLWPKAVRGFRHEIAVTQLLRSFDAFSAFNVVFEKYGLRVWVSGVEKIAGVQNKDLGLPRHGGISYLPSGAVICSLVLLKRDAPPPTGDR